MKIGLEFRLKPINGDVKLCQANLKDHEDGEKIDLADAVIPACFWRDPDLSLWE